MTEIIFSYNRLSHRVLNFMIIVGQFISLILVWLFLYFLGITNYETAPAFFQENPDIAVWIIFLSIPFFMLSTAFIIFKFWSRKEDKACIRLWKEYAILYYRGEEIMINKGEISTEQLTSRKKAIFYDTYILKIQKRKIIFDKCILKKGKKREKTLSFAMKKLLYCTK